MTLHNVELGCNDSQDRILDYLSALESPHICQCYKSGQSQLNKLKPIMMITHILIYPLDAEVRYNEFYRGP
jgi:hypothetical protein